MIRISMTRLLLFAACCIMMAACGQKASDVDASMNADTLFQGNVVINAENFPDENFRAVVCYILNAEENDTVPAKAFQDVEELELGHLWLNNLKGIEYFAALKQMDCGGNLLTDIDMSKNTALQVLECGYNQLTSINLSQNQQLTELGCCNNQLTGIDVSKNTNLTKLLCNNNKLDSIDVSNNTGLKVLGVNECRLKKLDVSKNLNLTTLYCSENKFRELDLSNNTNLSTLYCEQPFIGRINIIRPAGKPNLGLGTSHTISDGLTLIWSGSSVTTSDMRHNIRLVNREDADTSVVNDSIDFDKVMNKMDDFIADMSAIHIKVAADTLKFTQLKSKWEEGDIMYMPSLDKEEMTHSQRVHALRSMVKMLDEYQRIYSELNALGIDGGMDESDIQQIVDMKRAFEKALYSETH